MKVVPKRRWLRLLIYVPVGLLVLLAVLRLILEPTALALANRMLPGALGTDASLGGIDLSLHRGYAAIRGLRVAQPDGFAVDGSDTLLDIPDAYVRIDPASLFGERLIVEDIAMGSASIRLVRSTNGVLCTDMLGAADEDTPAEPPAETDTEAPAGAEDGGRGRGTVIRNVTLSNLYLSYVDRSVGEKPLTIELFDVVLHAENLVLDPAGVATGEPGSVTLTARMKQPPHPDAHLGVYARLGVMGADVPPTVAVVRTTGIELESFDPLVPPGVSQTLGGSSLDVYVDLEMVPELLSCVVRVVTKANRLSMAIGGTPAEPKFDKSSALFSVFGRLGGGVAGVLGAATGAGIKAAETAVETVGEVGKGAGNVVKSVGKGLFSTVKGVATGDLKEVGSGLKQTTVGTVEAAVDTVSDTAGTVVSGVGSTASAATGAESTQAWREQKAERFSESWRTARAAAQAAPFPPEPREGAVRDTDPAAEKKAEKVENTGQDGAAAPPETAESGGDAGAQTAPDGSGTVDVKQAGGKEEAAE